MASIKTIVNVQIEEGAQQVPQQAFNVPIVIGPSNRFTGLIQYYSNVAAMLSDGFLISDPEYIHVAAIFGQPNPPTTVGVGKYTNSGEQVDTFAVNTLIATGHTYSFNMGSTIISYVSASDTQQSILTGLLDAINTAFPLNNPVTGVVSGTGSSALLTLTATDPGVGVTYGVTDPSLTYANTTPNHSISQDIAAIQAVDNTWYGVICTSKTTSDILEIAQYIQTQQKVYFTSSSDPTILTNSTTGIGSQLKALNLTRTALLYSANPNAGPEAAWVGAMLPYLPGSDYWKFAVLEGIIADNLNDTQIANALAKNVNIYTQFGGIDITNPGVVSSGAFIDNTIFIDWLMSTMQVNVYQTLVNVPKVPYTNKGIAVIENQMRMTLQIGEQQGGLAPGWTVSAPDISKVSQADKASRTLNGLTFNATLAGAIGEVNIIGYVSV